MSTARAITGTVIVFPVTSLCIAAAHGLAAGAWWPVARGASGLFFALLILRFIPPRR